jgi:hypothetical protein
LELQIDPQTGMKNYIANGISKPGLMNDFDFIVPMQNEADGTLPKLTLDEYLRNASVMADYTVPAVGKKMNMRPSGYWAPQ